MGVGVKRYLHGLMLVIGALITFAIMSAPAVAQNQDAGNDDRGSAAGDALGVIWDAGKALVTFEDSDANPQESLDEWSAAFGSPSLCWGCELYDKMQSVTMEVGERGQEVFTAGAIKAINAFMGLWVVFQLYLLLSPTHANSPSQSLNTIFQRLVLMMIVLAVLQANPYKFIMEEFVFRTIDDIMVAAQSLLGGGSAECGASSPGSQLICSMHMQMGRGMGLGAFLFDDASMNPFPGGNWEPFQMIGGLIIFIAFAWMMIMLPFRLFDALIRIAVVSVILPVVVLAYQFKPTRGFCKQAVTSVLAAALTFLFTAIAVAIATELLNAVARPVIDQVSSSSASESYVGPLGAKEFMILVAAACGMAAFIKQAGTLASEFAGFQGSMGDSGGAGATAVAGAATAAAAGGAYGAAKVGGRMLSGAKSGAGSAVRSAGKAMFGKKGGGGDAAGAAAGAGGAEAGR